jgi:hypothetical protein
MQIQGCRMDCTDDKRKARGEAREVGECRDVIKQRGEGRFGRTKPNWHA